MLSRAPIVIAVLTVLATPAWAASGPSKASPADPAAICAAMIGDHPAIADAPTQVKSAQLVAATADLPAFCQVQGTIPPNVGIELRLPASNWNGKFFEWGRGGYCAKIAMDGCDEPLRRGYACVITDQGHKTNEQDDIWAYDNLQGQIDCGYRGAHVAALAGKALTAEYYRKPPAHSYFMGCSSAGRMAMVEAERFPWDFDGIIASNAAINKSANGLALSWNVLAALDKDGAPLLTPADVALVGQAAVAKRDMDDGVKDGVIGNPLACKFDPGDLQCQGAKAPDCLTKPQVEAVRRIYRGPVNSKGDPLYNSPPLPGSERTWIGAYVSLDGAPTGMSKSMTNMFRYLHTPELGENWKLAQFNWDEDYKQLGMLESAGSGSNPDLRPFKAAGGKLIMYHGESDGLIPPQHVIDFYEAVEKVMGGQAATRDFARLFLVPGLEHCQHGIGANVTDYIGYLEAWVERGKAPDMLIGYHLDHDEKGLSHAVRLPIDQAAVTFTRPIYPYPLRALYKGAGDPTKAENFGPAAP